MHYEAQPLGLGPLFWTGVASGATAGADVITALIDRKKSAEAAKKVAKSKAALEAAEAELAEVNAELKKIQTQQFMLYAMAAGAIIVGGVAGYALARYAHKRGTQ